MSNLNLKLADWAWGRPTGQALTTARFDGVIRYLSGADTSKVPTQVELQDYRNKGLKIHLVYQDGRRGFAGGRAQGRANAFTALAQAAPLGFHRENGDCIFFAPVDVAVTMADYPAVLSYFEGVQSVLASANIGVYGSADVVDLVWRAKLAAYRWQTVGWSSGRTTACDIYQTGAIEVVNGITVDVNRTLSYDTGDWFYLMNTTPKTDAELAAEAVWSARTPTDIDPLRQLSDMAHVVSNDIPNQVGMVGVNVSNVRADLAALDTKLDAILAHLTA